MSFLHKDSIGCLVSNNDYLGHCCRGIHSEWEQVEDKDRLTYKDDRYFCMESEDLSTESRRESAGDLIDITINEMAA